MKSSESEEKSVSLGMYCRIVRVSEIDLGVQHFCNVLVFSELGTIVGGDGKDMAFERPEQLDDDFLNSRYKCITIIPYD